MSEIPKRNERSIFLLTDNSIVARDVRAASPVLLTYHGSSDHLSAPGRTSVSNDTALVHRLWSPGADAFWLDGPESSSVVAVKVVPDRPIYWDGPNP